MNYPALLSFFCGFASLSVEILWVRCYGFSQNSSPAAFGFVLMAYLSGIAVGARLGSHFCKRDYDHPALWRISVIALFVSGCLTVILPLTFGYITKVGVDEPLSAFLLIASASVVLAFVFPIAHHLGADQTAQGQGRKFATVYGANVLGASLGPLVTGYGLLEKFTLQECFLVMGVLLMLVGVVFSVAQCKLLPRRFLAATGTLAACLLILVLSKVPQHQLIQLLNHDHLQAKTVIENRHGVITIFPSQHDDIVYGSNVYDGRTNVSPEINTNGLERALLLPLLQPEPERVLMVGLSIGSWLTLVREFSGVKHIDVVEINAGYIAAAQNYPAQKMALQDARVHVEVEDARRWLRMNADAKYDLIIMNTTLHWRNNSTFLLSREFLNQVRQRMAPGAVLAFNSTGSADAFFTASKVFAHAYRYRNFIYAAEFDFRERKNAPQAGQSLANLQLQGRPMFAPDSAALAMVLATPFESVDVVQKRAHRDLEIISDDNMITEFRYGRHLY